MKMGELKIQYSKIESCCQELENWSGELYNIQESVCAVRKNVKSEWSSMQQIGSRLRKIEQKLLNEENNLDDLENTLQQILMLYKNTEQKICQTEVLNKDLNEENNANSDASSEEENNDGGGGGLSIVDIIKRILEAYNEVTDQDWAGILEDGISYLEDFINFWTGDKKGTTGASDWCSLANSSIGLWKGLYDYAQKNCENESEFFGDIAKKNVGVLGLTGDCLGLLSSVLSASDGLDNKTWQSIVADYISSGKDVVSVMKSKYKLDNIGNTQSLAGQKAGLWSALDIYGAIAKAGTELVAQGFQSYEKYYADGKWDAGDIGATMVDMSMAGLYQLSQLSPFGLDDLIYESINKAFGNPVPEGMNYFQQAAEGCKILANDIGDGIANWIKGLRGNTGTNGNAYGGGGSW